MIIVFDTNGTARSLGTNPILEELGLCTHRRASHILPVNRFKKLAFRCLRATFGEIGRVADWTRQWSGPWRVTIIGTDATFQHSRRWNQFSALERQRHHPRRAEQRADRAHAHR